MPAWQIEALFSAVPLVFVSGLDAAAFILGWF